MNSKLLRLLSMLVVLSMIFSPLEGLATAQSGQPPKPAAPGETTTVSPKNSKGLNFKSADPNSLESTGPGRYIVQLTDAPLATYTGGTNSLAATSPEVTGERHLNVNTDASKAYLNYVSTKQTDAINAIQKTIGHPAKVTYQYKVAYNGFSMTLTPDEAAQVATLPGVKSVQRERIFTIDTDAGPQWIGAPAIWGGTATGGLPGTKGEGVVVGVLDTGINEDHPSFAATGADGYTVTNPLGDGVFLGYCNAGDPTFVCNNKLIGAYNFVTPDMVPQGGFDYTSPEDENGHGTHTSSTAVGNVVSATLFAPTTAITHTIQGVAPHANLIFYDISYTNASGNGSATETSILAALDQVVIDEVDVINFSFGSTSSSNPYTSPEDQAFLSAFAAGTFASQSAGNSGPGASTETHDAPWTMTVAASTHNRAFPNSLTGMTGDNGPADIKGAGFTSGFGPAEVVYAGNYVIPPATATDAKLCKPGAFPPGTFSGQIVLCDRGIYDRVAKAVAVKDGGAGGFILANASAGQSMDADAYALPGVHITKADGDAIKAWLADGGPNHRATISGTYRDLNDTYGDIMAGFSSRGPSTQIDVIKPDVAAPGVNIWGATLSPTPGAPGPAEYQLMSGTSMAAPHDAGAAALLVALHPSWSPAQVKSALMTTANTDLLKEDGATPTTFWDMGAGRIDLNKAGNVGFVLNETTSKFVASDPANGGDPRTLNLPSMENNGCLNSCTWTRTVKSVIGSAATYTATVSATPSLTITVTPPNFTLAAGGTQVITVKAEVGALPLKQWAFATIGFDNDSQLSEIHLPLAVKPTSGILPDMIKINTRRNAGSQLVSGLQSLEITDLTVDVFGLAKGLVTTKMLTQDPTNGNPFDNVNDGTTFFITATVPTNAKRLVAEVISSASPDVDMYVGRDTNGNGLPSSGEIVCTSASSTWAESCDLSNPAAGVWWILVQDWSASANAPDKVVLSSAVVPGVDAGNFSVEGPAAVPVNTPFDLTVVWNEPTLQANDRLYGVFDLGTDASNHGNIGSIPVDLIRQDDDVVKTASAPAAKPGETVTYTITVQPNVTPADKTYTLTDTLPAGLTLVPGSAKASFGDVTENGNKVKWTGLMPAPARQYLMTTSDNDPNCAMPYATSGAYAHWSEYGLTPASLTGSGTWNWTTSGPAINFYGQNVGQKIKINDNGFFYFDPATAGASPAVNTAIPDAAMPNNLLAVMWRDLVFNATPVYLINFTDNNGVPVAHSVAVEGVSANGQPNQKLDYEFYLSKSVSDVPGEYEIIFAYDNISTTLTAGTVGIENLAGTKGTQFAFNDEALASLHNGEALCFDYAFPQGVPAVITYQATVNADTPLGSVQTNTVESKTDNYGDQPATTDYDLLVAPQVTFTYNDLEDVVPVGTDLYVAGDFNSWNASAFKLTPNADYSVFTGSAYIVPGQHNYKYVLNGDWGNDGGDQTQTNNRAVTISGDQSINDYRNVNVGYAHLMGPDAITVFSLQSTPPITGEVYIQNVTNPAGKAILKAQVGYGTGTDVTTWNWVDMTNYVGQNGNNDKLTGTLTPSAAGTYSYTVRFDGNFGAANPNKGWSYGDLGGTYPGHAFDPADTGVLTVNPMADLSVTKTASSSSVFSQETYTYTLTVTNNGPEAATNVVVTDTLPTNVTFVKAATGCTFASGKVVCKAASLASGAVKTYTITVKAGDAGKAANTVVVKSDVTDTNQNNNTATVEITIKPLFKAYLPIVLKAYKKP